MDIDSHKKLIKEYYEAYKKIGYIECPAFNYERIYFLKRGFRHLIWKGTNLRDISDQIERLNLLQYVPNILKSIKSSKDLNENHIFNPIGNTKVNFWSISYKNNQLQITVVIRQINDGPKHFFSVMKRYK